MHAHYCNDRYPGIWWCVKWPSLTNSRFGHAADNRVVPPSPDLPVFLRDLVTLLRSSASRVRPTSVREPPDPSTHVGTTPLGLGK
ncbi:hypothetical protein A0H81_00018 [Grifola frondosa]|uniref:Uncharacterized protein n=1 Tax=Grifola frondosa TaxID=5627 RepID=A0A1C7MR98_GRIFR|nr:hypothetical protein A0H81_00018 [Grifola frondosa]